MNHRPPIHPHKEKQQWVSTEHSIVVVLLDQDSKIQAYFFH